MRAVGTSVVFTCEARFERDDDLQTLTRLLQLRVVTVEWYDRNDIRIREAVTGSSRLLG